MLEQVASGEAPGGGTHAVIQEQVQFKNLALAIVDEQHRFGVAAAAGPAPQAGGPPGRSPSGGSGATGAWGFDAHGAAHADDERHTHPAHAGHELLRRPGCVGHRRTAAGAHARGHQAHRRQPQGTR